MWNSVKIVKLVSILECFYSWTKTRGYIISELYKIWRVYRDDGRLSRELEVIFIVVGGCLSQLEVVCNKGRYRAARAAKNYTKYFTKNYKIFYKKIDKIFRKKITKYFATRIVSFLQNGFLASKYSHRHNNEFRKRRSV